MIGDAFKRKCAVMFIFLAVASKVEKRSGRKCKKVDVWSVVKMPKMSKQKIRVNKATSL